LSERGGKPQRRFGEKGAVVCTDKGFRELILWGEPFLFLVGKSPRSSNGGGRKKRSTCRGATAGEALKRTLTAMFRCRGQKILSTKNKGKKRIPSTGKRGKKKIQGKKTRPSTPGKKPEM